MPRPLSARLRRAMHAGETPECLVYLLTLRHPTFSEDVRLCNAGWDLTHQGRVYQNFPFQLSMPASGEDAAPVVSVEIDGTDRTIVEAIRRLPGSPTVELRLVLADAPDVVEAGPIVFGLRDTQYGAGGISGELHFEGDLLNEPCPDVDFLPSTTPGVFP